VDVHRWLEHSVQDTRLALRGWRRTPGFALAAVTTLALGIGANTAIFSIVSGVLLRPLPFAQPDRLVDLSVSSPGDPRLPARYATVGDLTNWRQASSLEIASTYSTTSQTFTGGDGPEQVAVVRADSDFFATLGAPALVGRTFGAGDPLNAVVVSEAFWRQHFAGDRTAIGRMIALDNEPSIVIGVMPAAFQFPYRGTRTDVWVPWVPRTTAASRLDSIVGRLRPGVGVAGARDELTSLAVGLTPNPRASVTPLTETVAGPVRRSLLVLLGAVGLVLLTACANVANLLLARAAERRRELAVRAALGAGRLRLVRQLLTESLLIAVAGAAIGLALGTWATHLLVTMAGAQIPRAWEIAFDWRVFTFLLGVCVLTGIGFGLAPALGATRRNVQRDLRSVERGSTRGRLRDGLVVAEIALAFVLLAGAGLLARTFVNLRSTSSGFDAAGVMSLHMVVSDANEQRAIEQRVGSLPGVRAAGFISLLPLHTSDWWGRFAITGRTDMGSAEFRYVTPGYFRAMGIPLLRGRVLLESDVTTAPKVLLVNDALARQYFANDDPVGRELTNRGTIVGVVGDVRQSRLDHAPSPEIYYPVAQNFAQLRSVGSTLVVKSDAAPESIVPAIRRAVLDVNPRLAMFGVQSVQDVIDASIGDRRLYAWLLGVFAAMGTLLAAAGVYGVIAYLVTLRTREFGIRLALGADASGVLRLVIGRGAALASIGVAIGAAGALFLTQLLRGVLYGVTPADPVTFISMAALLALVALVACGIPARRAARVDPAVTLRAE